MWYHEAVMALVVTSIGGQRAGIGEMAVAMALGGSMINGGKEFHMKPARNR
jgi:hypothetical protein